MAILELPLLEAATTTTSSFGFPRLRSRRNAICPSPNLAAQLRATILATITPPPSHSFNAIAFASLSMAANNSSAQAQTTDNVTPSTHPLSHVTHFTMQPTSTPLATAQIQLSSNADGIHIDLTPALDTFDSSNRAIQTSPLSVTSLLMSGNDSDDSGEVNTIEVEISPDSGADFSLSSPISSPDSGSSDRLVVSADSQSFTPPPPPRRPRVHERRGAIVAHPEFINRMPTAWRRAMMSVNIAAAATHEQTASSNNDSTHSNVNVTIAPITSPSTIPRSVTPTSAACRDTVSMQSPHQSDTSSCCSSNSCSESTSRLDVVLGMGMGMAISVSPFLSPSSSCLSTCSGPSHLAHSATPPCSSNSTHPWQWCRSGRRASTPHIRFSLNAHHTSINGSGTHCHATRPSTALAHVMGPTLHTTMNGVDAAAVAQHLGRSVSVATLLPLLVTAHSSPSPPAHHRSTLTLPSQTLGLRRSLSAHTAAPHRAAIHRRASAHTLA